MHERPRRTRPEPWADYRHKARGPWTGLFVRLEWYLSWIAWALGNWAFLDILENLRTLSVLIVVIFYFSESGSRVKQRHYQAWQVINTAQGRGGSGGRVEALQELNSDHVSLVGADASGAFLQAISLPKANLARCNLHASDLRNSDFAGAVLSFSDLQGANFRSANLSGAALDNVQLQGADLHSADLRRATLTGADLSGADLRDANLESIAWTNIGPLDLANLAGARNLPPGFEAFALAHGAVSVDSDQQWEQKLQKTQK